MNLGVFVDLSGQVCKEQGMIKHNMNDWFIFGKLYLQRQIRHTYSGGEHVQQYLTMIILVALSHYAEIYNIIWYVLLM